MSPRRLRDEGDLLEAAEAWVASGLSWSDWSELDSDERIAVLAARRLQREREVRQVLELVLAELGEAFEDDLREQVIQRALRGEIGGQDAG